MQGELKFFSIVLLVFLAFWLSVVWTNCGTLERMCISQSYGKAAECLKAFDKEPTDD